MAFSKVVLSGSTNGKLIKVAATATLGTAIHTAVSGTSQFDEVWLWAQNNDTSDRTLTIEWGDATAPDDNIVVTIPTNGGLILVIPGLILNNGAAITAFASVANKISIGGFVNRGP